MLRSTDGCTFYTAAEDSEPGFSSAAFPAHYSPFKVFSFPSSETFPCFLLSAEQMLLDSCRHYVTSLVLSLSYGQPASGVEGFAPERHCNVVFSPLPKGLLKISKCKRYYQLEKTEMPGCLCSCLTSLLAQSRAQIWALLFCCGFVWFSSCGEGNNSF